MILKNIAKYPYIKSNLDLQLEKVDKENINEFIDAVCEGFASDDPADPYEGLSDGYKIALKKSVKEIASKYKIKHYIARYNGVVIGTATSIYDAKRSSV